MSDNLLLNLSEKEEKRLLQRVEEDIAAAKSAHEHRCERYRRYYRRFRNRLPEEEQGDTGFENYSVPLTQIHVFAKWARQLESLFGDDAEIRAQPVGPSDHRTQHKVARYMTERSIRNKRIKNSWTVMLLWEIIFGRVHAYAPWVREESQYNGKQEIRYEGPSLIPLWPDDFLAPAETVTDLHDFSWVARRYRISPNQLLLDEGKGIYKGIRENFTDILRAARQGEEREPQHDDLKRVMDEAEGVNYEGSSTRGNLTVVDWYGHWRPLKSKSSDGGEDDLESRKLEEEQLVVSHIPSLHKVVGVKRLSDIYPRRHRKRPFVTLQLIKDGSYWSPGFGELLESIENEATENQRIFMQAGKLTVGPFGFFRPSSGFDENIELEPGKLYPSEDPQSVNWIRVQLNPEYYVVQKQALEADAERITGQTDQTLGRSSDRPNAPRTATGQLALIEEGNTRAFIDVDSLRDDASVVLSHFWELEQEFSDKGRFFRVTEEDAGGLFDTRKGGAIMEPDEFGSKFDFHVKFATSQLSKGADKERAVALYQMLIQNPLVATNPRALWSITNDLWRAFDKANFSDVVPEPPSPGIPKKPSDEWTLMLQGEVVLPHPDENEAEHLPVHFSQLEAEKAEKNPDDHAIQLLEQHIVETQSQRRTKQATTAVLEKLVEQMRGNGVNGGLQIPGGLPLPLQNLQGTIEGLVTPEEEEGPPRPQRTQ